MKKQFSIIIIITTMIILNFDAYIASSSNTLKQGDILNSSTYLISTNKLFTLGFFSLDDTSGNSYLGLWYTSYSSAPAWIANRNNPIHNNSGVLALTNNGDLIITRDGGDPIELYFSGQGSGNVRATATLTDSGNFILNSSGKVNTVLWQSFDHPTDTLLPGMELGVNHNTGKNVSLTSWFDGKVPKDGAFTLEWDPSGSRLVVKHRGIVYWSSGALKDGKFEYLPYDPLNLNYAYHNDSTEDGEYFKYSLITSDELMISEDRRTFSQWKMDYRGRIVDIATRPIMVSADACYGYKIAKPNVYEMGCQLWKQPECRDRRKNFTARSGYFTGINLYWNLSLGYSDCRSECWNDCECVGFEYDTNCRFFRGSDSALFRQDLTGSAPQRYVLISEPTKKSSKKMQIVIGSTISLAFLLFASFGYLVMRKLRHKDEKNEEKRRQEEYLFKLATSDNLETAYETKTSGRKDHDMKIFSFSDIVAATNNFSIDNKLGQGGFGLVYKGKLSDGWEIAVKRLSKTSRQGDLEFKNELILIAKLQHRNLVRVLGCCIHAEEKMLVYEYMPNKSLDSFLFDITKRVQLNWKTRLNIIEGIAQGILYLHKYSRMRVIHRDLKASNVLLDEHMNPKISDFGMARIFMKDETEAMTNRIVGTYGYMSPEYVMGGTFSVKSDVFSFGVLTIEIVSGRRNTSFYHLDKLFNLIGFAWMLWKEGEALQLKDETLVLDGSDVVNNLLRTVQVGLLCVQENAMSRPSMSDVIAMLTNDTMTLPIPQKPAFFTQQHDSELAPKEGSLTKYSNNYMSISTMEARS